MATDKESPASAPTWREVQELLRKCKKKEEVMALITAEKQGPHRPLFITRMQGRYKVLRNAEDDAKLSKMIGG